MSETAERIGVTDPELAAALRALMEARNWNQRRVADMLGLSQSAVSAWFNNNGKGLDAMNARVRDFLADRKEDGDGLITTDVLEEIHEICEECLDDSRLAMVLGKPGTGKTQALQAFAASHPDDCTYITVDVTTTIKILLEDIQQRPNSGRAAAALMRTAKKAVAGRLIIVDEADHLTERGLEALRAVWGDGGRCGMVLGGDPSLELKIRKLPQLASRMDFVRLVGTPSAGALDAYLDQANVHDEAARRLIIRAGTRDSFRAAAKLLGQARRVAKLNGAKTITADMVRAAEKLLVRGLHAA
jgi:DNA transposition AAA+ family ATPase